MLAMPIKTECLFKPFPTSVALTVPSTHASALGLGMRLIYRKIPRIRPGLIFGLEVQ